MRLDSMINDGSRLVENAGLARIDQPMEIIGLGTLEELAALPSFAPAAQLRIEQADSFDDAPVEGHIAAEGITIPAIHPERLVSEVLIAQEAGDFRARDDPGRKFNRGIQVDSAADGVGIGALEC